MTIELDLSPLRGRKLLTAVSGGADSMCMLSLFKKHSSRSGLNLICAHFEHGVRAGESVRDMEFVRSFCEREGISTSRTKVGDR